MYLVAIIGAVILLFLLFLYILFYITFHNSKRRHKKHKFSSSGQYFEYRDKIAYVYDRIRSAEFEQVKIKNRKGMELSAYYYHNRDNAPVAIMFHGYRSRALYDNAGGHKLLWEEGYNILIPDQRSHGASDGNCITFGIKERYDCIDWINYVIERFGTDVSILLVGVSMGAATVLMASGLCEIPENVKGVIADCPYSSPEAIIRKVIKSMGLPQGLMFPFVRLSGMIYGGFDVSGASPISAVKNSTVPTLIIHGDADGFVPVTMTEEMVRVSHARSLIVKGADHGLSYIKDTQGYSEAVKNFIGKIL